MEWELRTHLEDLLITLDAHADDAVLEYATGVLQTLADGDGGDDEDVADHLEHLDLLLEGGCEGNYTAIPPAERRSRLAAIAEAARRAARAGPSSGPPAASQDLAGGLHGLNLERRCSSSSGSSSSRDSCENVCHESGGSAGGTDAVPAAVRELSALCSGRLCLGFLQYALECRFTGSLEAMASFLLDSDDRELKASEAEWQETCLQDERERARTQLLEVRNKQQILQKFDLRPVPQAKDPRKHSSKSEPLMITHKSSGKESKVRYLEGRIVSQKGEKFIIEKTAEEWDGGSRGKVFTKGKRGKGFT
ncbi:hypothetical protein TSOC_002378 [Tetrabaena socialis]|uniref:Uncharacterized protein n=1 Tax=Tetrabaena socialis TaxID=47790 RepID=A0A2J8AEE5_9CHLO|nr:hypothetical protein TSOC_002378 [Tetrabaena socialis]|eukprot:PNH10884.1 hypothetical protein TSOC_002378 [Tetrabaena socialis]